MSLQTLGRSTTLAGCSRQEHPGQKSGRGTRPGRVSGFVADASSVGHLPPHISQRIRNSGGAKMRSSLIRWRAWGPVVLLALAGVARAEDDPQAAEAPAPCNTCNAQMATDAGSCGGDSCAPHGGWYAGADA